MLTTLSEKEWGRLKKWLRDQDPVKLKGRHNLSRVLSTVARHGVDPKIGSRLCNDGLSQALVEECLRIADRPANAGELADAYHPCDGT